jgi:hypothetical protein
MKDLLKILSVVLILVGFNAFSTTYTGKVFLGITKDTIPAGAVLFAQLNAGGGNNGNGGGAGGGSTGPDTASKSRPDSIKYNFGNGTSTYNVVDSVNLRWNNVKIQTYANGAGKMDTFSFQKWADSWTVASNINLIMFHGAGWLSYRFVDCVSPIVPSPAFQYASIADGSTRDSIGDPTLGGRDLTWTGLAPNGVYDVAVIGTKDSGIVVSQTLTAQGKTSTYNINNNCSNYGKLTGLVANSSGVLIVNVKGASSTSKTYINAVYLITQRVTNRILTVGGSTSSGSSSGSTGTPSTTSNYPFPSGYIPPPSVIPMADSILPPFFSTNYISGLNTGYYGPTSGWGNDSIAKRISMIGGKVLRTALPDWIVSPTFRDTSLLPFFKYYKNVLGLKVMVTLGDAASPSNHGNTVDHQDTSHFYTDSKGNPVRSLLFNGLYEKVWDTTFNTDGSFTVRPYAKNYFAVYCDTVAKIYGQYVDVFEVVNEPDFTGNATIWTGSHIPQANEMSNIRAPFQHYMRMIRIAAEVIKRRYPNALIAPGGLGYWQFWESMCKWSDNPLDGSLNDKYPRVGAAYIDVLSYHTYPEYYVHSNYPIVNQQFANSDTAASVFMQVQATFQDINKKYGWDGTKYPRKHWFISETNVPAKSTWQAVLSVDKSRDLTTGKTDIAKWDSSYTFKFLNYGDYTYQRNFIVKGMIEMERVGVQGVTVFTTGEHNHMADSPYYVIDSVHFSPKKTIPVFIQDGGEFAYTGYYNNMDSLHPGQESLTPEGVAYKTYTSLIGGRGYVYDSTRTKQLGVTWNYNASTRNTLPVAPAEHTYGAIGPINGAAFFNSSLNKWIYVVWARQTGDRQESLTYNYTFPALGGVTPVTVKRYNWDYSTTNTTTTISNSNIPLTAAPSFFEVIN